ncbi:putative CBP4 [Lyophyllum shimeji]|uniref:CBP4 n=1 Tax=Lyophyllum shimeji TaxID=47721 RepID=A0A9P3UJ66_LYOSH|nr:putative CBP4 [Lyophyllum shimeji]
MSGFPWGRFTVASIGLMSMGYVLMKATTPTEEQLYNEMAPDLRRKVDAARAARMAREAELKRQVDAQVKHDADPEAAKPIWADTPPAGSK